MRFASIFTMVALAGCFAISDTDRFSADEGCDLELRLRNYNAHTDDLFVINLVTDDNPGGEERPMLEATAIFEPLESTTLNLRMPNTVAPLVTAEETRPFIDVFGDDDSMRGLSENDHTWRFADACVRGPEVFQHDTDFDPIELPRTRGLGLDVFLCDVPRGAPIEARLYADLPIEGGVEERRALGMFRFTQDTRDDITTTKLTIPGLIDVGFEHFIDVYIDTNGNGAFDAGETAWSFRMEPAPNTQSCDLNGELPGGVPDPCAPGRLRDLFMFERFPACEQDEVIRVTLGPLGSDNRTPTLANLNGPDQPNAWLNFDPADTGE